MKLKWFMLPTCNTVGSSIPYAADQVQYRMGGGGRGGGCHGATNGYSGASSLGSPLAVTTPRETMSLPHDMMIGGYDDPVVVSAGMLGGGAGGGGGLSSNTFQAYDFAG